MTSKLILILVFAIMLVSMASAVESSYKYRVYETVDIKNPCYYNGTYCSAGATCTLTMYDPDNLVIVNNQAMTYGGPYFNYSLPGNNWSIGQYKSDMTCTDLGISGAQSFYVSVITGGNQALFLILAIASLILLIFAIWMQNEYLGFISSTLFIMTGLYALIYGIGNELFNMYTSSIGYVALGLGILFLIVSAYAAIAEGGLFSKESREDSLSDDTWGSP